MSAPPPAPIETERPPSVEFGPGPAAGVGAFARPLAVPATFNAGRVAALAPPGDPAVFGTARPEPDIPDFGALLALAEKTGPDMVVGFGFGGGSAMAPTELAAVPPGGGRGIHDAAGPEE